MTVKACRKLQAKLTSPDMRVVLAQLRLHPTYEAVLRCLTVALATMPTAKADLLAQRLVLECRTAELDIASQRQSAVSA